MFYNKKTNYDFQCECQDFPYWRIVVPHSIQRIQLFPLPGKSPTTI